MRQENIGKVQVRHVEYNFGKVQSATCAINIVYMGKMENRKRKLGQLFFENLDLDKIK